MCFKVKWIENCIRRLRVHSASVNFSETIVSKAGGVTMISDDHAVMTFIPRVLRPCMTARPRVMGQSRRGGDGIGNVNTYDTKQPYRDRCAYSQEPDARVLTTQARVSCY